MSDNTEDFGSERYRRNLKTKGFFTTSIGQAKNYPYHINL